FLRSANCQRALVHAQREFSSFTARPTDHRRRRSSHGRQRSHPHHRGTHDNRPRRNGISQRSSLGENKAGRVPCWHRDGERRQNILLRSSQDRHCCNQVNNFSRYFGKLERKSSRQCSRTGRRAALRGNDATRAFHVSL